MMGFLRGPANPSPDIRTLEEENQRLKDELRRKSVPQIPPPRVKIDQGRALELALEDIQKAPDKVLQCSLHLIGMYVPLDKAALTRVFDVINACQDVQQGAGARIEEIMAFNEVSYDQSEDLALTIGALLCHILSTTGNVGYAFAAAYLQVRGNRSQQYANISSNGKVVSSGGSDMSQQPGNGQKNYF